MNPSPSETSSRVAFKTTARSVGALNAVLTLSCAVVMSEAINDLAHRRFGIGTVTLAVVLAIRATLALAIVSWSDWISAIIRDHWRQLLPNHLSVPRAEGGLGRGDLALAIEQASEEPSLDVLATSAAGSLAGLGLVWWAGGWWSLAITVGLLGLAVPFYQRAGRRSAAMSTQYQARRALLESRQLELLLHAPELRALGAMHYGADEIAAISDSEHAVGLQAIRVALESSLVTEFLSGVSIGLVAMVVGFALLGGRTSLTHGLIAVLATSEVFVHVRRYGTEFHRRENTVRSIAVLHAAEVTNASVAPTPLLVAEGLSTEANSTVLNLDVRPGQRVVVTGPSGSGKTTLLHTLLGWRSPVAGVVRRTSSPVGYVGVESRLLSGSLRENLTAGADIDDRAIYECLASVGLAHPRFDDLDAILLPDGRGISSGERVRLVLTRALLARPVLLVIDDIAGVLDQGTRDVVGTLLADRSDLAIIEASVDSPLLIAPTRRIEVEA